MRNRPAARAPPFFYGATPSVVERLASRPAQRHPCVLVIGYRSPPLTKEEDAAEVNATNETRPDFVRVGLGMPKQKNAWRNASVELRQPH